MTPQQYEKLKSVIQNAVPSIMNLEFGCEVKYKGKIYNYLKKSSGYHSSKEWLILYNADGSYPNINPKYGKILGRPIRLDDVLLAMQNEPKCDFWAIDRQGRFFNWKDQDRHQPEWDLTKDLDNQSDDTKQFLVNLLITDKQ